MSETVLEPCYSTEGYNKQRVPFLHFPRCLETW